MSDLSLNNINSRILTPFTQSGIANSGPGYSGGSGSSGGWIMMMMERKSLLH